MLTDIFYWLLNMSITGTIAGLLVLLIRTYPKLPRRAACVLWGIPLVRLWLPALVVSPYSLLTLFAVPSSKVVSIPGLEDSVYAIMNVGGMAQTYFPITFKVTLLQRIFQTASIVWLTAAVIMLLCLLATYLSGIRAARKATRLRDRVYLSDQVDSPAVYGIIDPRILIPFPEKDSDFTYVLMHERAHIRRLDNLWRVLALVTAAVHWFNPFIWIFLKFFFSDLEKACDEAVLKTCTEAQKREYAAALLNRCESRHIFVSAFGGAGIHSRIMNIMTYRKMSVFSAVCMIVFFLVLAFLLLTNPA